MSRNNHPNYNTKFKNIIKTTFSFLNLYKTSTIKIAAAIPVFLNLILLLQMYKVTPRVNSIAARTALELELH